MHGVWVDAGADRRAGITGRRQSGVDDRHIFREDGGQSGLIEQPLLEVREVEGAIRHDRAAEAAAVLLLVHRQRLARERVRGVEGVVTKEAIERAAPGVRSALGDDVDVAAECPAQLCLAAGRHDLKLFDGIDTVGNSAQPGGIVIGRQAVDDEVVRQIALAGDRDALPGHRRRLRRRAACCRCSSATRPE